MMRPLVRPCKGDPRAFQMAKPGRAIVPGLRHCLTSPSHDCDGPNIGLNSSEYLELYC
jgi:hypothetical protein